MRYSVTAELTDGTFIHLISELERNPLVSRWSVSFEFIFCKGKTRFTHAIAANKRANSYNFKIKNYNLLTITFLSVYLMNRGKSSYMN